LGVKGAKRRDEYNQVYNIDEYLQTQLDFAEKWRALAGVRHNDVALTSRNHLAIAGVAPVSQISYQATNPVLGVVYRATTQLNAYASFGQGFETPTFNDLSYRSVNGSIPGLNLGLHPARSKNYEIGLKFHTANVRTTLAAFVIKARDELAVQANSGGRSVYENIPRTERRGVEFALAGNVGAGFDVEMAYTYLKALITDSYNSCKGIPCIPRVIPGGNRIPAVPANVISTSLNWRYQPFGLVATLEANGRSKIYVDDANSDAAPGFWSFNSRLALEQRSGKLQLSEFVRVDNLADRHCVDSVIVNESNSRFFEPDPGRTVYLGFTVAWSARDRN
jgi:iron complex outermembrane receptor protein